MQIDHIAVNAVHLVQDAQWEYRGNVLSSCARDHRGWGALARE
jgi:hypothetical protein